MMRQPVLLYYPLHEDVIAFSTMRRGGVSVGNYAEFNINHYCGDDEAAIRENRKALCQLLDLPDSLLIMPHQVHQTRSLCIDEAFLACTDEEKARRLEGIDAVLTNLPNVCIGVSTADCIPVLLYDPRQQAAAAIHAGWRGTVQRIVLQAIADMKEAYGTHPEDLIAQIGPGISLDSFEVGDEVYDAFSAAGFDMPAIAKQYPTSNYQLSIVNCQLYRWHIDLPACNRLQLLAAGVAEANIHLSDICTVKQSDLFFSARRLGIQSGRIFTGICKKV